MNAEAVSGPESQPRPPELFVRLSFFAVGLPFLIVFDNRKTFATRNVLLLRRKFFNECVAEYIYCIYV